MLKFSINNQIPDELIEKLSVSQGPRSICSAESGLMNMYIILDNITDNEVSIAAGPMHVIYQHYDGIPFLVMHYDGMSFDMPLFANNSLDGNALNIFFIELHGYILKHIRVLGLSEELMEHINKGIQSIQGLSTEDIYMRAKEIYAKISQNEMLRGGVRYSFTAST